MFKNVLVLESDRSIFFNWWKESGLNVLSPWKTRFEHNKAALYSFLGIFDKLLGFGKTDIEKYDTIILPETGGSLYIVRMIRKWNPKAKIIFPMGNIVAEFGPEKIKPLKDMGVIILHYDKNDVVKYGVRYYDGMVYPLEKYKLPKGEIVNDLFFIGQDKGRADTVLEVQRVCQKLGLKTDFTVVLERKSKYGLGMIDGVKFVKEQISYDDVVKGIASSKMILDITQKGQRGITLRPFESFMYRKKMISNNPSIRELPYYNANNMMILDGKNYDEIEMFMNLPYQDISEEIYARYTVKGNFENVLEAAK